MAFPACSQLIVKSTIILQVHEKVPTLWTLTFLHRFTLFEAGIALNVTCPSSVLRSLLFNGGFALLESMGETQTLIHSFGFSLRGCLRSNRPTVQI
jgi:hypothetical protein